MAPIIGVDNAKVNAQLVTINSRLTRTYETLAARPQGSRNILITGAGNVGSNIGLALLQDPRFADYNIHYFDNMTSGHRKPLNIMNAQLHVGDLESFDDIDAVMKYVRPELVVHTAAYISVKESVDNPDKYWDGNYYGARNLFRAMEKTGVTKSLFSQTAACYDGTLGRPLKETDPFKPNNPYGETKARIAQDLMDGNDFPDIRNISLHYFNVCGSPSSHILREDHGLNTEGHLIPIIWQVAFYNLLTRFGLRPDSIGKVRLDVVATRYGEKRDLFTINGTDFDKESPYCTDGTCVRDYVGMQLMTFYHLAAIDRLLNDRMEAPYEAFNLGTMKGSSVTVVANTAEKVFRQEAGLPEMDEAMTGDIESPQRIIPIKIGPRRPGDPGFLVADPTKAQQVLAKGLGIPQLTLEDFVRDAFWSMLFRPMGYGDNPNIPH